MIKKASAITKISSKNQITVPSFVRKYLGVSANDKISWQIGENNTVLVTANDTNLWQHLQQQQATYGSVDCSIFDWE